MHFYISITLFAENGFNSPKHSSNDNNSCHYYRQSLKTKVFLIWCQWTFVCMNVYVCMCSKYSHFYWLLLQVSVCFSVPALLKQRWRVMTIVIGNGHGEQSSNPGQGHLHFT